MSNFLLFADATEVINILTIVVLALLIVICLVVCVTNKKNPQTTKSIVYGGACVAASFALSFIKVSMTYGGSITLASMLPLFIYCYVFGVGKGLVVGVVYGLLQFIQGPYFMTVPQFFLDYILPFAGICLAGVFKKVMPEKGAIFCGAVLFSILRLAFHIGAGIIWFYQPDGVVGTLPIFGDTAGMSAFVYSFLYNAIYMVPETIILLAVLWYLVASKQFFTLEKMLTKVKDEPAKQD